MEPSSPHPRRTAMGMADGRSGERTAMPRGSPRDGSTRRGARGMREHLGDHRNVRDRTNGVLETRGDGMDPAGKMSQCRGSRQQGGGTEARQTPGSASCWRCL